MTALVSRSAAPRGYILPYGQLYKLLNTPQTSYRTQPVCRYASATTSKPRVLEKPTRFNPPSHGKRLKEHAPRQYGPQLTTEQRTEQKTKQYPRMFPPPGSFMHWFLTNRTIHMYISLSVLVLLAAITAFENWRFATAFRDQLPSVRDFFSQPLTALSQVWEVIKLENVKENAEMQAKRKHNVEDVEKRYKYRVAHGLQDPNNPGWFGYTVRSDEETLGTGMKVNSAVTRPVGVEPGQEVETDSIVKGQGEREGRLSDLEAKEKRPVKKWFGIW